jgi:glycosyltransferase involved in cell wall biosynthesis
MKRILFDLLSSQPAGTSKFHGGGEYIKAIFNHIVINYSNKCEIIVFFNKNKFIDEWIIELIKNHNIKYYDLKNLEDIKEIFEKEKIDILYSGLPYDLKKEYIPDNVLKIGTIHGLRPIEKPLDKYAHLYTTKKYRYIIYKVKMITGYEANKNKIKYSNVLKTLDKIICVSEHTKYSICNYYPNVSMNNIKVFYTPEKKIDLEEIEKNDEGKYILLLGGDRWLKNVYRAILAIEGLFEDGKLQEYKIIIVGKLTNKIKKRIKHIDKYKLLDYVETEKLESLYSNCDIFLYPTLNEGFGMPPLEAMKYGKTCIVSAVTSLPEVCGDAVYYTNPYDIYEIRNRILRATDEKISKKIIQKQLNKINQRQKEDLDKICEYIIN